MGLMRRLSAIALVLMLMMPLSATTRESNQYSSDVEDLVSRVVEAYGGREKLQNMQSVYGEGEIKAFVSGKRGSSVTYLARDRKLRVETLFKGSSEVEILNGERGWRTAKNGALQRVDGIRYLGMIYQFKHLYLPYGLMKGTYRIKDAGWEMFRGMAVRILDLSDDEGPPMKVFIDTETYRIVKVIGYFTIDDSEATLTIVFGDFKTVDGVPFPFRMTDYGNGFKIKETVMKSYSLNGKMDQALFSPER